MDTWFMIHCCIIFRFSISWVLFVWSFVVLYSDFLWLGYLVYDLLLYCAQIITDVDTWCMIFCSIVLIFSMTWVLGVWTFVVLCSDYHWCGYLVYDLLLYYIQICYDMGTFLWSFVVLYSDFLWHGYFFMIFCSIIFRFSMTWVLFYDLL